MRSRAIPYIAAVFLGLCACRKEPSPSPGPGPEPPLPEVHYGNGSVVGRVLCEGKAKSGVVVSDGYVVDTTGLDGCFSLESRKLHGYVFMSIPDGYDVPSEGVIPQFFAPVGEYPQDTVCFTLIPDVREEYTMFVLGDMHLAKRHGDLRQFDAFARDLGSMVTDGSFAVTLGDMSWDAYWSDFDLRDYLTRINGDFKNLRFFHTIGNHDHDLSQDGDWESASAFKKIIGPAYYSFNRGGVHFIVLDDIICTNSGGQRSSYNKVSAEQVEWLQKDLKYLDKSKPLAVFMHAPLYKYGGSINISDGMTLINSLRGFSDITFFSGHTHTVYNVDVTQKAGYVPIYENCCGAVCGPWWYMVYDFPQENVHVSTDGAPGGYKVVSIRNGKMSWYFKATGRDPSYQFRTYDRNMICLDESLVQGAGSAEKAAFLSAVGDLKYKSSENLVYINVWDYDPQWRIEAREDGKTLEVRQLKDFKDPMYLYSMEAYCFNKGFTAEYTPGVLTTTCAACTSNHFFSVKASRPDSTIEITVTDRFGRSYRETMRRPKALKLEY